MVCLGGHFFLFGHTGDGEMTMFFSIFSILAQRMLPQVLKNWGNSMMLQHRIEKKETAAPSISMIAFKI